MEGKIVKINEDILRFLYPDYTVKSFVSFLDIGEKVIYNGKYFNNLKDYLSQRTKSFISIVGPPDLDLSSRNEVSKFIFEKKGRTYSQTYESFLESLDDDDYLYCIKMFIMTGHVPYTVADKLTLYSLFKSLVEPTSVMLDTYLRLVDIYPFKVIESSFLTFIRRVVKLDVNGVSPRYSMLIKQTHSKISSRIKPAVLSYSQSNHTEVDFLNLLLSLRK